MSAQATAEKTTVRLTVPQVALLRQIVFRDLEDLAGRLQDEAGEAAQGLSNMAGDDAEGMYASIMRDTTELLDVLGWSTRGDGEMLVRTQRERRSQERDGGGR